MDILVLSVFAAPEIVGVYGVVTMFGNAIRSIRRSFDPIITSVISCIGSCKDPISSRKRIASSFSYAWFLVTATQLPIFAFLICFASMLLTFYGPGFSQGADALLILCGFWVFNGAGSLAGLVVVGLGRSDLGLLNVLAAIAGQMVSLVIFVSPIGFNMGMEGAAISAGLGYTLQNILQHAQMKKITGMWNYTRQVLPAIFAGITGFAVMVGVFFAFQLLGNLTTRVASFLAFLLVYGASLLLFWNAETKHQLRGGLS
jgi:O-antigen/teichoic acid export membrane protein